MSQYRAKYDGQCGNCENYDFIADNRKGYCDWYKTYYYPDDSCSHQKNIYQSQSGCYITTIVCDVLGYEDNCFVLNTLRSLRDNVMQKDEKYKELLMEYDIVGPEIAQNIEDDKIFTDLWRKVYNKYLIPTTTHVMNKEYDQAIEKYTEMYKALKGYYAIEDINLDEYKNNYDQKNGGHGVLQLKRELN